MIVFSRGIGVCNGDPKGEGCCPVGCGQAGFASAVKYASAASAKARPMPLTTGQPPCSNTTLATAEPTAPA